MERRRSQPRGEGPIMREEDISLAPDYGARYGAELRSLANPYGPGDLAPQTLEMRHERMNHDLGAAIRRYRAKPQLLKEGGQVKPNYGSTEDIVGHGKTKAAAKSDYARKMKAVGLKPKGMAAGGSVASKRADGCAARGKTKGRMV